MKRLTSDEALCVGCNATYVTGRVQRQAPAAATLPAPLPNASANRAHVTHAARAASSTDEDVLSDPRLGPFARIHPSAVANHVSIPIPIHTLPLLSAHLIVVLRRYPIHTLLLLNALTLRYLRWYPGIATIQQGIWLSSQWVLILMPWVHTRLRNHTFLSTYLVAAHQMCFPVFSVLYCTSQKCTKPYFSEASLQDCGEQLQQCGAQLRRAAQDAAKRLLLS